MIFQDLSTFLVLVLGGAFFEAVLSLIYDVYVGKRHKKYHFTFSRYLFLLLMPLFGVVVSIFEHGSPIIEVFFLFALVGPIFEWAIGYSYKTIVGQKLWTYHKFTLSGYTSLLAIPFWGMGGVLFYFLARVIQ